MRDPLQISVEYRVFVRWNWEYAKPNPVLEVQGSGNMGWLLCFLLILIALIGSQFSPADHDPGRSSGKTRSTSWSAPSAPSTGGAPDPGGERTGGQTR
jgi:hypothetical protein